MHSRDEIKLVVMCDFFSVFLVGLQVKNFCIFVQEGNESVDLIFVLFFSGFDIKAILALAKKFGSVSFLSEVCREV